MATGLPYRQPGRQSFADPVAAPTQTTTGASGESRGVQSVGGESIGGVQGGAYNRTGNAAAGIGNIFAELMAPQIARKKQEKFFQGFVAAKSGQALEELTDSDSPLTRIFGPSGFAEGAQFYAGKEALNSWASQQLQDMPALRELSPDDFALHLTDSLDQFMTGDPGADAHVMSGYLEANESLVQTHATARYEWQQNEAIGAFRAANQTGATVLQEIGLTEGLESDAFKAAVRSYAGSMAPPEGMDPETFSTELYDGLRLNMAQGNFYAVEVMRQAGADRLLDPDQQKTLQDDYRRYGSQALSQAANSPDVVERLSLLDAQIKLMQVGGEGISAEDAIAELASINQVLSERTGVNLPHFDGEDMVRRGGSVMTAQVRVMEEQQRRIASIQEEALQTQAKIAAAEGALEGAGVTAYRSVGGDMSVLNGLAAQQYSQGQLAGIAAAYTNESHVFTNVKGLIAAGVRAGIGEEYTTDTEKTYNQWLAMREENFSLAKEYFGDAHANFTTFENLLKQQYSPDIAYRTAFGFGELSSYSLNAEDREAARESFNDALSNRSDGWIFGGTIDDDLPEEARNRAFNYLESDVARDRRGGGSTPIDQNMQASLDSAFASGEIEAYGKYLWINGKPTRPLHEELGLQAMEARLDLTTAVDAALEGAGIDDFEDLRVMRVSRGLVVQAYDDDGMVVGYLEVPLDEIRAASDARVAEERTPPSDFNEGAAGTYGYSGRGL